MNALKSLGIVLTVVVSSCCSTRSDDMTGVPDGFYLPDEAGKSSLMVEIEDPGGSLHRIPVVAYDRLTIERVVARPLDSSNEVYRIQVNIQTEDPNWSKKPIILVAANKAIIELGKMGGAGSSHDGPIRVACTIDFEVNSKQLAENMRDKLIDLKEASGSDTAE